MKKRVSFTVSVVLLCMIVFMTAGCGNQSQTAAENVDITEVPESEAADESVEITGSYVFLEDVMGGQLQVSWTLTLNEDMTYELICENGMMGTSTYTGTFTEEDTIVTTSPLEGDDMPIAAWFESDYSCQWTLEGDSCMPLKYEAVSAVPAEMPANAPGAVSAAYTNAAYASLSASEVCDIYLPEGEGPFPTIVVVHGGGFAFGAQNMEIIQPIFAAAMEHGYAVVSVDYRKSSEAVFPAALADVKAAVRFVRANAAEYGFDEERIAIWGESAGAYLSLMTALTPEVEELNGDVTDNPGISSGVVALVDFYGPVEFYTMDDEYKSLGVEHDLFASDNSFESKFVGQNVGLDETVTYQTYWQTYQDSLPDSFTLHAWIQAGDADTSVAVFVGMFVLIVIMITKSVVRPAKKSSAEANKTSRRAGTVPQNEMPCGLFLSNALAHIFLSGLTVLKMVLTGHPLSCYSV